MNPVRPALKDVLERIEEAPTLWRLNGVGTTMLGSYRDPNLPPSCYFSVLFFTLLFVPVIPIKIYLISPAAAGRMKFHGKIGFRSFAAVYPRGLRYLLLSSITEAAAFIVLVVLALGAVMFLLYNIRHK
jgi:hypothetical protein